jgi:hypothetical protein
LEGGRILIRRFNLNLLIILVAILFVPTIFAQEVFDDPEGKYTVTLPAGWLAIVNQDSLGRKEVNIVFKVRENGALKVRSIDEVEPNIEVMSYAKRDEEQTVRFMPSYDKISLENFVLGAGRTGALLSYDYKNASGQPFTGRNYYLRTGEKQVYLLRFTGRKNILGTLRNQTDAIARSFKAK